MSVTIVTMKLSVSKRTEMFVMNGVLDQESWFRVLDFFVDVHVPLYVSQHSRDVAFPTVLVIEN